MIVVIHKLYEIFKEFSLETNSDPINDKTFYLNFELRQRLKKKHNISGYSIVQCVGDCIFVPTGVLHQVANLIGCIKIAIDFVSPEHIPEIFNLLNEMHLLPLKKKYKEDKLQIKNILYCSAVDLLNQCKTKIIENTNNIN